MANRSAPVFVDIDNDGDIDCFSPDGYGIINYYKNIGTNTASIFVKQTGTDNPLSGINVQLYPSPTFVDIDNDGDMDCFSGEGYGTIKYYKNTGSNTVPIFVQQSGMDSPLSGVDVGYNPSPTFVDIDNDGDMDAFIGEAYGTIKYYKNTGSNTTPTFVEQTGINNPLDGVDIGHHPSPSFVDIDNDGDMDFFCGEHNGTINYYKNMGSNIAPIFVEQIGTNNTLDEVDVGSYSTPTFVDIDNDGDMDLFCGELLGIIKFYSNGFLVSSEEVLEAEAISIFPNPVVNTLMIEMEKVNGEVMIFNTLGQVVQQLEVNEVTTTVDVSALKQGQYVLKIVTDEGRTITKSFVK